MYVLKEVDGELAAEVLRNLNEIEFSRFKLTDDHLETGFWWLLKTDGGILCGFCGLVEMRPHVGCGYLKRAYVSPDHRGHNLQQRMIETRIAKARELGWHQLVSETKSHWSAHNLAMAGFELVEPEQKWGEPNSMYFSKVLC